MAQVTYYFALPFVAAKDGLDAGEPVQCSNTETAVVHAEALFRKEGYVGALAFSCTSDPATGHFSDAKIIRALGDALDDLSALG